MEFSPMKLKFINNLETGLKIYIGITEVSLNIENISSNKLLSLSNYIDINYDSALLQFLNTKYILNSEHIYSACYFTYNAFLSHNNISKSKEIELLLYLSVNRQIKIAIRDFGLPDDTKKIINVMLCLSSFQNNLDIIYTDLQDRIKFQELSFKLDDCSIERFNLIKNYFDISDNQIKVLLKSANLNINNNNINEVPLDYLYSALTDIIREKMVLLSVEKTS
jgi:tRNA threonylcarbamoyladenosine modification (KEOPS) complex Cgi121 subunit